VASGEQMTKFKCNSGFYFLAGSFTAGFLVAPALLLAPGVLSFLLAAYPPPSSLPFAAQPATKAENNPIISNFFPMGSVLYEKAIAVLRFSSPFHAY
jgi:hypothetical protein